MIALGFAAAQLTGLRVAGLFLPYLLAGAGSTFFCVLVHVFITVAGMARRRADRPLQEVARRLRERAPLLVLPALVLPLFLAGFTAAKSAIPFLVGYSWDRVWSDADRLIFGDDAWRIAAALLGTGGTRLFEWFYTVGWGAALYLTAGFLPLYASRRTVALVFTAMLSTWILGGVVLAYAFSAAGPVFAGVVDPSLSPRFQDLDAFLALNLRAGPIRETQAYLLGALHSHVAVKGGGISAMPSMHLGALAVYVIAARRTPWLWPAALFWALIFVCSGYFGYHYWVDGLAGALVACACWALSAALIRRIDPAPEGNIVGEIPFTILQEVQG